MRPLRAMFLALALCTALAAPRAAHAGPPPGASEVLTALEAAGVADAPGALKAVAMRLGSALRNAGTQVGRWGITQTEQVGMHLLEHPGVRRSILAFVRDNAATLRVQGTAMIERHLFTPLLESSLGRRLFATAAEVAYRAVARGGVDLTTAASQVVQTSPWGRFAGWASTTFPRVGRAFGWVAEVATSVTAASIMNFATVAQVADAVIDEALESYQTTLETIESADDLDAFNRNVDLLLERLVDGRARLAEGQTLGRALRRLRANLDLGRQPFDGIVSRAAVPAETTSGDPMAAGEVWVLDGPAVIDAAPGSTPWKSGASQLHVGDNQLSAGGAVVYREVWNVDKRTGARQGSGPVRAWNASATVGAMPATLRAGETFDVTIDARATLTAGEGYVFLEGWLEGKGIKVTPEDPKRGYFHARPGERPTDTRTYALSLAGGSSTARTVTLQVRGVGKVTWTWRRRG